MSAPDDPVSRFAAAEARLAEIGARKGPGKLTEIELELCRLRLRIINLESELALLRGTPGSSPTSETLTEYTHDVPPDAPR
jgi:hypothetical protein